MIHRREFITLLGGAAVAWPLRARAQPPATQVIGFLNFTSPDHFASRLRGFRQGLKEAGYVKGENVTVAYRWAENQIDRLPALAVELVRQQVSVIVTSGSPAATLAAKAATTTNPIVFQVGEDPVRLGLVASLARPGGNLTGINILSSELVAKRLELLRELVPGAVRVAVLVNPVNAVITETTVREVEAAARALGLEIRIVHASTNPRSMPPSQFSCASESTPSSSAPTDCSAGRRVHRSIWHRTIRSPRPTHSVTLRKSAG